MKEIPIIKNTFEEMLEIKKAAERERLNHLIEIGKKMLIPIKSGATKTKKPSV